MKTFFIPARERFVPESKLTGVYVESDSGLTLNYVSDSELSSQVMSREALSLDAGYLLSHGVEPSKASDPVISTLDIVENISSQFDGISSFDLSTSDIPSASLGSTSPVSTETSSSIDN